MQSPTFVKLAAIVLTLVGGLTACGQKGPLYLPQPEQQAQAQQEQQPQASTEEQAAAQ